MEESSGRSQSPYFAVETDGSDEWGQRKIYFKDLDQNRVELQSDPDFTDAAGPRRWKTLDADMKPTFHNLTKMGFVIDYLEHNCETI